MLAQDELLVQDARRRPDGYGLRFHSLGEAALLLAAVTAYAINVPTLDEHTVSRDLGLPDSEFDLARGILAAMTGRLPASMASPQARVHVAYGLPDYIRLRRELAGEPLLGMVMTYAMGADYQFMLLEATVDFGSTARGRPRPQMAAFRIAYAHPALLEGRPTARPEAWWFAQRGQKIRERMVRAGRDLGQLIATDFFRAAQATRRSERDLPKVKVPAFAPGDRMRNARVVEAREAQLLVSVDGKRLLVERALAQFEASRAR